MNRNHLKLIACACMFCDHMGLLLFPGAPVLRYIGRLAMPMFAFFIGEGCRHTRSRKKYLLRLGGLAVFCQAVFAASSLLQGQGAGPYSDVWFFNVLFTFTLACPGCFAVLDLKRALSAGRREAAAKSGALFALWLVCACAFTFFAWRQRTEEGWSLCLDFGLFGLLLPVCAVLFDAPARRAFVLALALTAYCFMWSAYMPYVWFSLLSFPLLLAYNGKGGSPRLKPAFYLFYPAHLGLLYLVSLLAGV